MAYHESKPPADVQVLIDQIKALPGHKVEVTYLPAAKGGGGVVHGQGIDGDGLTGFGPDHEGIEWVKIIEPAARSANDKYAWTWGVIICGDPGNAALKGALVGYSTVVRRGSRPKRGKRKRR